MSSHANKVEQDESAIKYEFWQFRLTIGQQKLETRNHSVKNSSSQMAKKYFLLLYRPTENWK